MHPATPTDVVPLTVGPRRGPSEVRRRPVSNGRESSGSQVPVVGPPRLPGAPPSLLRRFLKGVGRPFVVSTTVSVCVEDTGVSGVSGTGGFGGLGVGRISVCDLDTEEPSVDWYLPLRGRGSFRPSVCADKREDTPVDTSGPTLRHGFRDERIRGVPLIPEKFEVLTPDGVFYRGQPPSRPSCVASTLSGTPGTSGWFSSVYPRPFSGCDYSNGPCLGYFETHGSETQVPETPVGFQTVPTSLPRGRGRQETSPHLFSGGWTPEK